MTTPSQPGAVTSHPATPRSRPDPTTLRLAGGFIGVAAASALVSSMLAPAPIDASAQTAALDTATAPQPSVQHVTQYVTLKPGQTAPPQAVVRQQPAPAPRTVIVQTRQSGSKP
jgi:hypothetical protein